MAIDYLPFDNYKIKELVQSPIDDEYLRQKIVGIRCPKCKTQMPVPELSKTGTGYGDPGICTSCGLAVQRGAYDMLRCSTEGPLKKIVDPQQEDAPKKTLWDTINKWWVEWMNR